MPIKLSKKGGGTKKRSFGQAVGDFKRKGYSATSARRIVGSIQKKQEGGSTRTRRRTGSTRKKKR